MNENQKPSETSPWKKLEQWHRQQSRKRIRIFIGGLLAYAAILLSAAWCLQHFRHPAYPLVCPIAISSTVLFFILWPLVCFKFKQITLDKRKVNLHKFGMWWLVTIWLSVFVATIAPVYAGQTDRSPAGIQQAATTNHAPASPKVSLGCNIIVDLLVIIAAASIIVYALWRVCVAAGICGQAGNNPPQAPPNGGNNNPAIKSGVKTLNINTNVALPVTVFYLSNGVIISNSAGSSPQALPPLFDVGGVGVSNDTEIATSIPGISTPPSIALWEDTNAVADATLDPTHNYKYIYNYSLLTSTNLPVWSEGYTVIGWVNTNPVVPLVCTVTYTNGVPETTNWMQAYGGMQPTNIVVYGTLPSIGGTAGNQWATKRVKAGDQLPPGGTPIVTALQFYKLAANTNAVVTQWPY